MKSTLRENCFYSFFFFHTLHFCFQRKDDRMSDTCTHTFKLINCSNVTHHYLSSNASYKAKSVKRPGSRIDSLSTQICSRCKLVPLCNATVRARYLKVIQGTRDVGLGALPSMRSKIMYLETRSHTHTHTQAAGFHQQGEI